MKKIKNGLRVTAALCAVLGWWGLLYPGLTLTPDTVRIVCTDKNGGEVDPELLSDSGRLYLELLAADRDHISFRSRLLTGLNALWEAFSWDKSTEN